MSTYRTQFGDVIPDRDNLDDGCELEYGPEPVDDEQQVDDTLEEQENG